MTGLTVERVEPTEEACTELGAFLIPFHECYAYAPLAPETAMANIWATAKDSLVYVVRDDTRVIIGSIALFLEKTWYSETDIMWNRWLCVTGRHESSALRKLLAVAREEADKAHAPLIIERSNHRGVDLRGNFGRIAEAVGYVPFGHQVRMT